MLPLRFDTRGECGSFPNLWIIIGFSCSGILLLLLIPLLLLARYFHGRATTARLRKSIKARQRGNSISSGPPNRLRSSSVRCGGGAVGGAPIALGGGHDVVGQSPWKPASAHNFVVSEEGPGPALPYPPVSTPQQIDYASHDVNTSLTPAHCYPQECTGYAPEAVEPEEPVPQYTLDNVITVDSPPPYVMEEAETQPNLKRRNSRVSFVGEFRT
uniref:Uncharacterized protein n=1 Tax=Trypanosoma congolense (strain IL3000) TaxID=1068625 RepID=G0UTX5_TRYCI|nr:conserved hypothetical protein [Trypanosoma congolense IL3000]